MGPWSFETVAPSDGQPNYRYVIDLTANGPPVEGLPAAARPTPVASAPVHTRKVIVIDAGHGGKDPGALGGASHEKDLTLAAAKALKRRLERDGRYLVVLDRAETAIVCDYIRHGGDAAAFMARFAHAASPGFDPDRDLVRIGLANYFAGAMLMPYQSFLAAAQGLRHDLEVLMGARGLLEAGVLGLLVEVQLQGASHEYANTFANIDRYLRHLGFSLFDVELYRYSRSALPGFTRCKGATPPKVNAYCSKEGTISTTSMAAP